MEMVGMRSHKGQITIPNLLGLFITFIVYLVLVLPVLAPMIDQAVIDLGMSGNPYAPATAMILQLLPFILLACLVITGINYASNRAQPQYYPPNGGY